MLDAEGYPKAFIDVKGFRYEFRRASLKDGRIVADVVITPKEESL
jgi:methionyl-tRNA formyltransferase